MEQILDAIYCNGVFTPLEPANLPENQRVRLKIDVTPIEEPDESLLAWQQVYSGLLEEEISEVERVALDRTRNRSIVGWGTRPNNNATVLREP